VCRKLFATSILVETGEQMAWFDIASHHILCFNPLHFERSLITGRNYEHHYHVNRDVSTLQHTDCGTACDIRCLPREAEKTTSVGENERSGFVITVNGRREQHFFKALKIPLCGGVAAPAGADEVVVPPKKKKG
jgi:hypothetical protein